MILNTFYNKETDVLLCQTYEDGKTVEFNIFDAASKFENLKIGKNSGCVLFEQIQKNIDFDIKQPESEFVYAKLTSVVPVEGTKLKTVVAFDGTKEHHLICGAENCHEGMIAVLAKEGSVLPGGLQIIKREIRGIISAGMLCSRSELGEDGESDGIIEITNSIELGNEYK